ncbi:MAG TPA: acetylglutamate kinase [Chitinophagaceae bacterium]|jgi:acetylglutamate kinase|nr:acetylglutamate kinase [Chitinophagaceae bacterium]
MDKLFVIKIGGNIVDDDAKLTSFLVSFATIKEHKILVHGGGKVATKIGDLLGIESKYVDGRRITDAATIDLVTMVYAGLINKKIVAQLQQHSCNALGVTGADGNLIPAVKRPEKDIDYGLVGDVKSEMVNPGSWSSLINSGFTPVAAPITHDENGQLLNTNADTIAQEVAKALSKAFEVSLIFSFEKSGVLLDVNNESSLIKVMSQEYYSELREKGSIFAGMIPKLDNAFSALKSGVKKVVIGKAENLHALIEGSDGTSIIHE